MQLLPSDFDSDFRNYKHYEFIAGSDSGIVKREMEASKQRKCFMKPI